MSTLKGGHFAYLSNLSTAKAASKVDTAVSTEPQGNSDKAGMDGWMLTDPIIQFLLKLPGFNPALAESTRREIVSHHFDVKELPFLWNECALADNPIGLFTHKVTNNFHSIDWQMRQMEEQAEAERQAANEAFNQRLAKEQAEREARQAPVIPEHDKSIYEIIPGTGQLTPEEAWKVAISEMELEMSHQTYEAWVKRTDLLSVTNGSWKVCVPNADAKDWLEKRLDSTVRRVLGSIVHNPVTIKYVVASREKQ